MSGLWLSEAYATGWSGTAVVAWDASEAQQQVTAATMMATLFYRGFAAGQPCALEMIIHKPSSLVHDTTVRDLARHGRGAASERAQ